MLLTLFFYGLCVVVVVLYLSVLYWGQPYRAYFQRLQKIIALARSRRWVLQPKATHEVPSLDYRRVEEMSRELNALEFFFAADFVALPRNRVTTQPNEPPAPIASPLGDAPKPAFVGPETKVFLRVFLSRQDRCLALLSVAITVDHQKGICQSKWHCAFTSLANATDGGEGWQYGTSNWETSEQEMAFSSFTRRPRVLRTYRPGAALSELWAFHQTRREQVANAGHLEWKCPLLCDAEENLSESFAARERIWNSMTPLKMAWLLRRFKREKNKTEWLGELSGKL